MKRLVPCLPKPWLRQILLLTFIALTSFSQAQNTFPATGAAGIGTEFPNTSALLDITSTTKGVLIPRMTKKERDAIVTPATGLLIYQTNSTPAFYYFDGSGWKQITTGTAGANKNLSNLTAPVAVNVDLDPQTDSARDLGSSSLAWKSLYLKGDIFSGGTRFISTAGTDNTFVGKSAGEDNTTGSQNTFIGQSAGVQNTIGKYNTASGYHSMYSNTEGYFNTANGHNSLHSNTTGEYNIANGGYSLYHNTTGFYNTANGFKSLYDNTTGEYNTATGYQSMYNNTTGVTNTAVGASSLYSNTSGGSNTANGESALYSNTSGSFNTANGNSSLYNNTTGTSNTANGYKSLSSNTTGASNTSSGYYSLLNNGTGDYNTAIGRSSMYANTIGVENSSFGYNAMHDNTTGDYNTASGVSALYANTTGDYNTSTGSYSGNFNDANTYCTFNGYDADQTVSTNFTNGMALGNTSRLTASNQVRVGNSSVTSIGGYAGWTNISDGRYKKEVKENVPGIEFINKLKPVTYHLDVTGIRKFLSEDITGEDPKGEQGREDFRGKNGEEKSLIEKGIKEKEKVLYTGFIAQDVEQAANELGFDFSGVDKPQNENSLYGLRYAEFVVPLVKAVQELSNQDERGKTEDVRQNEEVEKLKDEISNLKSEIQSIKSSIGNSQSEMTDGFAKMKTENSPAKSPSDKPVALLGQNIPNPFDNTTLIPFRIPNNCDNASILIAESSTGKIVRVIPIACGETQLSLEAGLLASGTYSYSLMVDGITVETKMMVLNR